MKKADSFVQPMRFTGMPNTGSWAGYDYLQWTGDTFHPGLDYNYGAGEADKGMPIVAIANGFVEKIIKWDGSTKGFGNHVFLKHELPDGTIVYSHYCHLDSVTVSEGIEVNEGAEIGKCGGSGGWPSHLHLEIRLPLNKGYEFWPKGMSKEWIAANYFDPYGFIEKRKNPEGLDDEIIRRADAFIAVCTRLDKPVNKDVVIADIDRLITIDDAYDKLTKRNDALTTEFKELTELSDQLKSDNQKLLVDVGKLKIANTKGQEDIANLTEAIKRGDAKYKTLEVSNTQLGLQVQKSIDDIEIYKKRCEEAEKNTVTPVDKYSGFELLFKALSKIFTGR